jgi:beta-mannosidase
MRRLTLTAITLFVSIIGFGGVYTKNINSGWKFRQIPDGQKTASLISESKPDGVWLDASVPGTVHTDLLARGKIGDPYFRTNEKGLQWIDKTDWEYKTSFNVSRETASNKNIILRFEGLDTYATVFLNGVRILSANNMFRTWEADIKKIVRVGANELVVKFKSPITVGLEKLKALGYSLPASNDQSENGGIGDKRVSVFTRKAGYHFGWDWGPRLVTSGIWRPVKLIAWNGLRITDLFIEQNGAGISKESMGQPVKLMAKVETATDKTAEYICKILVNDTIVSSRAMNLSSGTNTTNIGFEIRTPRLWWPNGLGSQPLYKITVEISANGSVLSSESKNIGLRTINLIRKQDVSGEGESFCFEVNGRSVFAKGANIIPGDVFLPSISPEKYEFVVKSAAEANMNMLRVWGGGVYEDNIFYDLCDKYGIMVWQDFMFACAMYPGDDDFLENVRLEAADNVKRLRNHPSVALWCGNNEIETAWAEWEENKGWGWKEGYTKLQRQTIWHSYDTLFHKIIPSVVKELTNDQPYWHSSPSRGYGQLAGYSGNKGDVHYWGVWHGREPIEAFRKYRARFMSEYGFQSFPEFVSVKKYTLPQDWDIESEVMASHQRSGIGNLRIREYMKQSYAVPDNFEKFLYVGQLLQAEAIKIAIESHRIDMPFCQGSLYWQLNDCWPVASWSGIDYYLKWKAMHYFAREAFKNRIVASVYDKGIISVYAISDIEESPKAVLEISLTDFSGKILLSRSLKVSIPANGSSLIASFTKSELGIEGMEGEVLLHSRLVCNGELIDEDIAYFTEQKNLKLPATDVELSVIEKNGEFVVTVHSDKLCKNLMLVSENNDENFSDNFFDLLPGSTRVVKCRANVGLKEFKAGLRVIKL